MLSGLIKESITTDLDLNSQHSCTFGSLQKLLCLIFESSAPYMTNNHTTHRKSGADVHAQLSGEGRHIIRRLQSDRLRIVLL